MRDSARRIRNIVGDLKTFSRADDQSIGRVDFGRVLDAAVSMAWTEIRHRARLVKDYTDVPAVTGNESRLGQVFLNLLTNAAQSIEEGHVDDNEIRVTSGLDPQGRIMIEIRDTGCGIPSEQLARASSTRSSPPNRSAWAPGSGWPSATASWARSAARSSSIAGPAWVARFASSCPRHPRCLCEPTTPSTPAPAEGPRGRILVIDDEADICEAMQEALTEHEVVTLTDSRVALERLLAGEYFDVIFCDLMMPNLAGWELHAQLGQQLPEVAERVVFVTGGAFTPRARDYVARVSVRQLEKPFDLSELLSLVSRRLGR